MGDLLVFMLVFYAGIFVGLCIRSWLYHRTKYNGTVYVTKNPDKTVYSLVVDDDPESLEFKKRLVLKVVSSYQSPDRN